jgi:hypothetical protein
MGKTARLPEPVYRDAKQEAEQRDVSIGAVVEDWRDMAEQYRMMEGRR